MNTAWAVLIVFCWCMGIGLMVGGFFEREAENDRD